MIYSTQMQTATAQDLKYLGPHAGPHAPSSWELRPETLRSSFYATRTSTTRTEFRQPAATGALNCHVPAAPQGPAQHVIYHLQTRLHVIRFDNEMCSVGAWSCALLGLQFFLLSVSLSAPTLRAQSVSG